MLQNNNQNFMKNIEFGQKMFASCVKILRGWYLVVKNFDFSKKFLKYFKIFPKPMGNTLYTNTSEFLTFKHLFFSLGI